MRCHLLLLNVALVSTVFVSTAKLQNVAESPNASKCEEPPQVIDVRLPKSLQPLYYDLELQPFMYNGSAGNFSFRGHVNIVLDCRAATDVVTLHVKTLNIEHVTMTSSSSSAPAVTSWQEESERQFLRVHLDGELEVGERYAVALNFTGPLKDDMQGLYLSSYELENQTIYLATTQFQPTNARKAFPCFDEPAIKSHFNVTLIRPAHLSSLSNTPVRDSSRTWTEDGIDWVADVFETTPKMSTYLLAFVISDFLSLTNITTNNVTFRVWARPESIEQARYALEVGVKVLTFFEDYYNISYPLPKQDMIAIPDFSAGAMENWGLIAYRETDMLYQPNVSSEVDKQKLAITIGHELAHQWFGNLVTPSWWDDLWLNEGFASYMMYVGIDFVYPDWRIFDMSIADLHRVFNFDSLVTSHPIYVPVYHPDEISEIFDEISYYKGSAVIAMMQHFLGEHTFKSGLNNYLTKRAYDVVFHDDLWNAMTEQAQRSQRDATHLDVKAIMDTWTMQMNYPIVTLTQMDKNYVKVTQARYLKDQNAPDPGIYKSPFNYTWDVPITLTSSVERNFNKTNADVHWFWKSKPDLTICLRGHLPDPANSSGWILGNVGLHGYYRVNYNHSNWRALCKQLMTAHQVIPPINRAQIINDAWSFVSGNYLPIEIALQTVEYLHHELDFVPWTAARSQLSFVDEMLSRTALYSDFKKFMLSKIQQPFRLVGMNNTGASHVESLGRTLLVSLACTYDEPMCLANATSLFKQWMENPQHNPIDAVLRKTVYCTAIRLGGEEEWDFAYRQYRLTDVAAEKESLQRAMGCSNHTGILSRYLNMTMDPKKIRKQDVKIVISSISYSIFGRALAWDFFRTNWDRFFDYGISQSLSRMIGYVTSYFNTDLERQELQEFTEQRSHQGTGERAFQQALEKTQSNIAWMKKNEKVLSKLLCQQTL